MRALCMVVGIWTCPTRFPRGWLMPLGKAPGRPFLNMEMKLWY